MAFVKTTMISVGILAAAMTISPVSADIYKHIDENGNVSFSDQPILGAEKIKSRAKKSAKPASDEYDEGSDESSSGDDEEGKKSDSPDYRSLQILTPREGKVVDSETGSVQVILLPTPSLGKSDELVINIDGKDVSKGRDVNLSVQNLPNGNHSVSSRIEDSEGKVIIESASVTFQIGE